MIPNESPAAPAPLLPCPFCEGTSLDAFSHFRVIAFRHVEIEKVQCLGCSAEALAESWNRRPTPSEAEGGRAVKLRALVWDDDKGTHVDITTEDGDVAAEGRDIGQDLPKEIAYRINYFNKQAEGPAKPSQPPVPANVEMLVQKYRNAAFDLFDALRDRSATTGEVCDAKEEERKARAALLSAYTVPRLPAKAETQGAQLEKMEPWNQPKPDCDLCKGSGFYGDNGPGRKGNAEYIRCDCTLPPTPEPQGSPARPAVEMPKEFRGVGNGITISSLMCACGRERQEHVLACPAPGPGEGGPFNPLNHEQSK